MATDSLRQPPKGPFRPFRTRQADSAAFSRPMAQLTAMSQRLSSLTSATLLSPKVTEVRNSSSPSRCSMTKSSCDLEAIGLGDCGPQRGPSETNGSETQSSNRQSRYKAQLLLSLENYVLSLSALSCFSSKLLTNRLRRTLRPLGSRRLLRCRLCRSLSLRLRSLRLADLGKQSLEDCRLLRSQTLHNLRLLSSFHFFEVGFASQNVVLKPCSDSLTGCKVRSLS